MGGGQRETPGEGGAMAGVSGPKKPGTSAVACEGGYIIGAERKKKENAPSYEEGHSFEAVEIPRSWSPTTPSKWCPGG